MFSYLRFFAVVLAGCCIFNYAHAQSPKSDPKPDYSKEAFVVEQTSTRLDFENDGTGKRESLSRVRIQSDAGVQHFGVLTLPYQNLIESLDIDYVRVHKPDGTVVSTPLENIQDMPTEITRQAPFYSDLHEKQIAVKGLSVGDMLEFHAQWHVMKPLAPGQFWYSYNFSHDGIILQEQLQISVPHDRAVKWKSAGLKPDITDEGALRIFTWKGSQLTHKSSEQEKIDQEEKVYQLVRGKLPPPDVQISSFQSWEELGRWYGSLQQERVKPTDEIRAKATELTKTATDDTAKLRALYKYVSTEFRYIGVAFGIGRYQPHSAADVLSNQYGDCKDKHTLLASLLDAAGIKAYPALINSVHEIDPDVPSPAQFDHMITAVPQKDKILWLDTTSELAPFAYLLSPLHDKPALVVTEDKPSALMTTAGESLTWPSQTFSIDAKLSESGTLEGKVQQEVSGADSEVIIRLAFRRVPLPNWKDLVQQMSYAEGFAGDVSDVTAGIPEKTEEPFHFSYNYNRKDFPDWPNRRVASALPPFSLPAHDTKPSHPIWLGAPQAIHYESHVQLPPGYSPQLPYSVHLNEDFAEYYSSYSAKGNVLSADRKLIVKLTEVPEKEYEAYKKFRKAVEDDYNEQVVLSSGNLPATTSYRDEIWQLPYSNNSDAARAYDDAREEYEKHDSQAEIASLKRAVEIDPKFTRAWLWLGEIYSFTQQPELALQAYRKAIDIDQQPISYKALGFALMRIGKFEDAIPVWQDLIKIVPGQVDALSALGGAFFNLKRYAEAAATIESAIKVKPDRAGLYLQLGSVYLREGDDGKATAAFKKAVETDPLPLTLNDVAYEMADANKNLPLSLEYAQEAVRQEEVASQMVKLSELQADDLRHTNALAAYWDTLGWVYFRLGNYEKAELYLKAAWTLSEGAVEADHLGQVYEKQGKNQAAIHAYQLALAVSSGQHGQSDNMAETRARLEHLRPGASTFQAVFAATEELSTIRTFKLARVASGTATAEYFLLLGPGSKVEDVKFIHGSDQLKSIQKTFSSIPFKIVFPDDGPTRLVRRAMISCSSVSGCNLVLFTPGSVGSVN